VDVEFQQPQEELSLLVETVMRRVKTFALPPTDKPDTKEKEKSQVMGYHRNSCSTVAARLFRSERKFKFPENRQLDPHSDRYCPHTPHFALTRDNIN